MDTWEAARGGLWLHHLRLHHLRSRWPGRHAARGCARRRPCDAFAPATVSCLAASSSDGTHAVVMRARRASVLLWSPTPTPSPAPGPRPSGKRSEPCGAPGVFRALLTAHCTRCDSTSRVRRPVSAERCCGVCVRQRWICILALLGCVRREGGAESGLSSQPCAHDTSYACTGVALRNTLRKSTGPRQRSARIPRASHPQLRSPCATDRMAPHPLACATRMRGPQRRLRPVPDRYPHIHAVRTVQPAKSRSRHRRCSPHAARTARTLTHRWSANPGLDLARRVPQRCCTTHPGRCLCERGDWSGGHCQQHHHRSCRSDPPPHRAHISNTPRRQHTTRHVGGISGSGPRCAPKGTGGGGNPGCI